MYDAQLGRFTTVDPMIEKHYNYSPYAYVYNDPIKLIDPTGKDTIYALDKAKPPTTKYGYTGKAYVKQNGTIKGPYTISTYPSKPKEKGTVNEGEYPYNNKYGHAGASRKGINLVDGSGIKDKERKTPGTNPDGSQREMEFINAHDSKDDKTSRGSDGCTTCPTGDPEGFFNNFDWSGNTQKTTGNSTGTYILARGENADKIQDKINNMLFFQNNPQLAPKKIQPPNTTAVQDKTRVAK